MLKGNKNVKDGITDLGIPVKDSFLSISYKKTSKLITALYMVTDMVDKEDPIRNKLRYLGAEIISDMHGVPLDACNKIAQIVSFLDVASAMNLISEMNCSILKKEFLELNQSIQESMNHTKPSWLGEFLIQPHTMDGNHTQLSSITNRNFDQNYKGHRKSNGHVSRTRIGVQKGGTLMKALSDKVYTLSDNNKENTNNFFVVRSQRRDDIIKIIQLIGVSSTIKDIKDKVLADPEKARSLVSCSEKTLQRELVSMVRDGVLNKTGEKRWSRYFLKG